MTSRGWGSLLVSGEPRRRPPGRLSPSRRSLHAPCVAAALVAAAVCAWAAEDPVTPRRLTEQAVERALAARRLTIEAGSVSSGHFVTAPAALDPSELPVLVIPSDAASGVAWARAEYRLEMRLSIAPSGLMTSALRVHIRAWPSGAPGAAGAEPDGRPLGSNRALEERFMRAVGTELERVAHLFPPETEDSKESEPPAGSRQPPK